MHIKIGKGEVRDRASGRKIAKQLHKKKVREILKKELREMIKEMTK